jgi:hypothetical protein
MRHFLGQVSHQKTGRPTSGQARVHQADSGGCTHHAHYTEANNWLNEICTRKLIVKGDFVVRVLSW